jgi:hypothetical protein
VKILRYLLISDGSSDVALIPIIDWLLRNNLPNTPVVGELVDFRPLGNPPRSLDERIKRAIDLYGSNCDVLFVHRDAENESHEKRMAEIRRASTDISYPRVGIVPIRMQEAWLLIEEAAIRKAANNPNGRMPVKLPAIKTLETLPDPKNILYELLRTASGLNKRRADRFNVRRAAIDVANYVQNWTPLHDLSAFTYLNQDVQEYLMTSGWLDK